MYMKNNSINITIVVALVVGAAAFFGGMKYQQSQRLTFSQFAGGNGGNFMMRNGGQGNGNRSGMRPVSGEIISSDNNSITVKMADGSSKIVLVNDKTSINKAEKATTSDLTTGQTVAVFGNTNSDGSVTAQNIQLNPQTRGFGGPGAGQGGNSTPAAQTQK